MLLLAILHLTAFVTASEYGSFNQAVPHFVLPNREKATNIIYNFEQTRRDQPPHIEQRDESIGIYMNKPKFITTTSAPHISETVPKFHDLLPKSHFPGLHTPQESNSWNYGSAFPSTIPPPPSPNWSNYALGLNQQPFNYHTHELNLFRAPLQIPISHPNPYPVTPQQSYPSLTWNNGNKHDDRKIYIPKYAEVSSQLNKAAAKTTTPKPTNEFVNQHIKVQQNSAPPHLTSSRGNYKYNWNHNESEPQKVVTVDAANVNKSSPPVVPTLTPWHDGFGK